MKVNIKLIALLATVVAFSTAGCRTPVATDPMVDQKQTALYQAGYFYAPIDADADTVFRTSIRTLDKMGMLRTGETHGEEYTNIFARKVGDKRVILRIRQIAPNKTEVRIRVGILGSLPESQMIFAKIRDEL